MNFTILANHGATGLQKEWMETEVNEGTEKILTREKGRTGTFAVS